MMEEDGRSLVGAGGRQHDELQRVALQPQQGSALTSVTSTHHHRPIFMTSHTHWTMIEIDFEFADYYWYYTMIKKMHLARQDGKERA